LILDVLKKIASEEKKKDLIFSKDQITTLQILASSLNLIEKGKFFDGFVQVNFFKFNFYN